MLNKGTIKQIVEMMSTTQICSLSYFNKQHLHCHAGSILVCSNRICRPQPMTKNYFWHLLLVKEALHVATCMFLQNQGAMLRTAQ